ncbi:hypothetical protein C8J56DRAFT_1096147 [Mycena floridula]|nr:hypothetical protein C8J56DRAFT_1096147 [Mycena floridula]
MSQPNVKRRKTKMLTDDASSATSKFTEMPLDIMLNLLQIVHPSALLSLRDVNQALRNTLDSQTNVWTLSREFYDIPEPWEDFGGDEVAWARFLFGTNCLEEEALIIDFGIMKRLCPDCRKELICHSDYGVNDFEWLEFLEERGEEISFSDVIPSTTYREPTTSPLVLSSSLQFRLDVKPSDNRSRGHHFSGIVISFSSFTGLLDLDDGDSYYFLKTDLEHLVADMTRIMQMGDPERWDEYEKWLAVKSSRMSRFREHEERCESWKEDYEEEQCQVKARALREKYIELGYHPSDVSVIEDQDGLLRGLRLPMSNQKWIEAREKLDQVILNQRRIRLMKDHKPVMDDRISLSVAAYSSYAATLEPRNATWLPTLLTFNNMPEIRKVCEQELDVSVTLDDFPFVPQVLADWVTKKFDMISSLADFDSSTIPNRFHLASTIFRCTKAHQHLGPPVIFAGDEAMRHVSDTCEPEVDHKLSGFAANLVRLASLDPDTATVTDMDKKDDRFQCCARRFGCDESHLFTWRSCLNHLVKQHRFGISPDLRLADLSESSTILSAGPVNNEPKEDSLSWVCGHCTVYTAAPVALEDAKKHVQTVHGLLEVSQETDILFAPGVLPIYQQYLILPKVPKPSRKVAKPNAEMRCFECTTRTSRTFIESGVLAHIKAKHREIQNPIKDVHYGVGQKSGN